MTLRASVVMDYQNVHLTARDVFMPGADAHLALIHPVRFARRAVAERNSRQRPGYPDAEVGRILVYRGLPHVDYATEQHRRCVDQARQWERDGATIELRDLKYRIKYGADGNPVLDINGKKIPHDTGREKGIDVLVALACVREAQKQDTDLVILASRDTDLVPVLDEVCDLARAEPDRVARIETVSWFERGTRSYGSLKPTSPRKIWNTNLGRRCFDASLDPNDYS